jgi:hypothetical protein
MRVSNMQEKKNIRLLVLLVLLITATVIVSWMNIQPETTVNKNIFKVQDIKAIDRITLESANGKVELEFNGARWKINDKYEADRNLVDVLFATIQQAEPKRPVASSMKDSITNLLIKQGIKVSLFSKDQPHEIFYAGGNQKKTQAFFKREGDDMPYVMIIPGYRVYTSGIFELAENDWRDKRIFSFNWRNFKNLTATFPSESDQNFKVTFIDNYFGVEGITPVDTAKLNSYLDAVSLLTADSFIGRNSFKAYDSLLNSEPEVIIEVTDVADRRYQLFLYRSKEKQTMTGKVENDQLAVFNRKKLSEIFRKKDYFIKRE